ncbi:unnamed protein product [Microthlaspi erraticum]|uniref:CCHC-type domain-containing protein n=1 Tax=Microthlaspi erraticum TaxID=1685480 RepID=A0A6D2IT92_9BRAS|nr:unnamed protein product [Microthlaspi erraticum]
MRSSMHTSRASLVELAASVEADLSGQLVRWLCGSAPAILPRSQQQQRRGGASFSSGSGRGGLPAQGQKRSRDESSGGSQGTRGACYRCGSTEHRMASCPRREGVQDARVCYHCRQPGHLRPACPQLQRMGGSDSAGSGSAGESDWRCSQRVRVDQHRGAIFQWRPAGPVRPGRSQSCGGSQRN